MKITKNIIVLIIINFIVINNTFSFNYDNNKVYSIVVEETIKWMKEDNEPIPEPLGLKKFKGNLTLRVPPEVHRELAIKSAEEGVSINQFILSKL